MDTLNSPVSVVLKRLNVSESFPTKKLPAHPMASLVNYVEQKRKKHVPN